MTELAPYYQAADALIQASLAEGAGISPLEALACGIPVVATAVGGLAAILQGRARLVPRGDASAAADELLWIAAHPSEARAEALRARQYVVDQWDRRKTFADLLAILESTASQAGRTERTAFPGTSR
jgi:glycosyltransferase involved in cell wall biosynthesis